MEDAGRYIDKKVDVNDEKVHEFFDNRVNKKLFHRYNLVNYQDNHPELAIERDKIEKNKILPLLKLNENSRILDIGCGVGRWGDALAPKLSTGLYVGVDYSEQLIEVAKKSALEDGTDNKRLYLVGKFQQIDELLKQNHLGNFDLIIVNGVLMYINDYDVDTCITSLPSLLSPNGNIYIKESVGIEKRFTLNDIYSEELTSQYSAIYRSIKEYNDLFERLLPQMRILQTGEPFENDLLHTRKETSICFWFFGT